MPIPSFENPRPKLESVNKIQARYFILRKSESVSKTVRSETCATRYSKINKHKFDKSRVPKCYAMTT